MWVQRYQMWRHEEQSNVITFIVVVVVGIVVRRVSEKIIFGSDYTVSVCSEFMEYVVVVAVARLV